MASGHSIQMQKNRIDHILGQKSNLSEFKKVEIISRIFSDHNAMRIDINYKKKTVRNTNTWRLNMFLNNQQVTEEIKREIKKFLETNDSENMTTQNLWDAAKAVLRGNFIAIQSYLKKQEKHQKDNLTLYLKQMEKEEQQQKKINRRKEIIKIQAKINEKEMEEIVKRNKAKSWLLKKINKLTKL